MGPLEITALVGLIIFLLACLFDICVFPSRALEPGPAQPLCWAPAPQGSPFLVAHRETAAGRLTQHRAVQYWPHWEGRKGWGLRQNVTILGNASAEAIAVFQALNSWPKG